jgi:hypothetical protein
MPLAHDVAVELRKLADSLDTTPDAVIVKPVIHLSHAYVSNAKERFITLAKLMPRPINKGWNGEEITLEHETPALYLYASIAKSLTCTLVQAAIPAKYSCDPILSLEEEEAL